MKNYLNYFLTKSDTASKVFILMVLFGAMSTSDGISQVLSCGDDVRTETIAHGLLDDPDNCVDISSTDMLGAHIEVWIEDRDCGGTLPSSITFTAGGTTVTALGVQAAQTGSTQFKESIYRAYISGPFTSVCVSNLGPCDDATSMALYIERVQNKSASALVRFDSEFHGNGCVSRTITLDGSATARDFEVFVPIHEKSDDGREVEIKIEAKDGSQSLATRSNTYTVQNAGVEASLFSLVLPNVASNADEIIVSVCSPSGNGDSFGVGSVTLWTGDCDVECDPTCNGGDLCEAERVYKLDDSDPVCSDINGQGVVFQRDTGCRGNHTPWRAGNDLFLSEFSDGTARITGTITNGGQTGHVDICMDDLSTSGNTWTATCYTSNLGNPRRYYNCYSGTIRVGNNTFTVEQKAFDNGYIIAPGASNQGSGLGIGAWSGGSWGGCTEWFAKLTEVPVSNNASINISADDSKVCLGETVGLSANVSGGSPSCNIQWQRRPQGGSWANWTTGNNPTSGPGYLSSPGIYQFRALYTCGNCDPVVSNVVNIDICPDPDISIEVDDDEVCLGETVGFSADVTGGTGACSVQWQRRPQGGSWANWTTGNNPTSGPGYLSAPGVYQFRAIYDCDGPSCGSSTSNVINVEVIADPDITIESDLTNICVGYNVELTYDLSGGTGSCSVQWQRRPQGGTWADFGNGESPRLGGINFLSTPGVYQYRATYDCDGASCGAATSNVVNVEVFADPDISVSSDDTEVCVGETISFTSNVSGGAGSCSIQWQNRVQGGTWADWATVPNPSMQSMFQTPGDYQFRAIYDCDGASCGAKTSNVINVEVFADPGISIEADDTEVCKGEAVDIAATVSGGTGSCAIQWERRVQGGTWSDAHTGQTIVTVGTGYLSAAGVYQYRAIYDCDGSSCGASTSNVVNIEVFENPDISIAADDVEICIGETVGFSATVTGGTGTCEVQWQRRPQGGTWADWTTGNNPTSGPGYLSAPGVYQFRAIYDCDGASCGAATSNVVNIEVFADPDISIAADDVEVCIGETVGFSATVTGGTGTCDVQWQRRPQGGTWADWTTGNNPTSGPGYLSAPGVYQFRAIYDCDGASCGAATSNVVNIEVFADPDISIAADDVEICIGETVGFSATVTGGTGTCEVQWQRRPQGGTWADWTTGNNPTSGPGYLSAQGVYQFRAIYDCDGASCGAATSNVVNIEVFADPDISIAADDVEICIGETVGFSATVTGGTGTCEVQWQRRPQGGTWADWTTGNNPTSGPGYLSAPGVYQFRAIYDCDGASCGAATSNVVNIEVFADPDISIAADDVEVCIGETVGFSATVTGGTGTCDVQWQRRPQGGTWADWTTGNNPTSGPGYLSAPGVYQFRAIYDCDGASCGQATSNVVNVEVFADPAISITSDDSEVCLGETVGFSATATGGTGTCEVQWQRRPQGGTWADWATGTNPTSGPGYLSAPGVYQFRAIYDCDGASCGQATSNVVNVEVFADPAISITSDDSEVCLGETVGFSATATGGTGTCEVQWQRRPQGGTWADWATGTNPTSGPGYLSAPGVYQFRAIYDCDGASCGQATSNVVNVEVFADPAISITSDDIEVCIGETVGFSATVTGGTGTCEVQWQRRPQGGTWADWTTGNNPTVGPGYLSAPGVYQFRAIYDCDGASCGQATSNVVNVEVFADPAISITSDDSEVCLGETVGFSATVTGGTGTCEVQWQRRPQGGTWVDWTTGTNPTVGPGYLSAPGVYQFRAIYDCDGASCGQATSNVVNVEVFADPAISITSDDSEVCLGETVGFSATATGGTGICEVQWQRRPQGGTWADWATGTNPTSGPGYLSAPGVYQFRAIYDCDGASCGQATSNVVNVEVFADPAISITSDDSEVCLGETVGFSATATGGTGICEVQWQRRPQGGTWADWATGTNPTSGPGYLSAPGVYQFRAIYDCDGASCGQATSNVVNVEVFADPAISITSDDSEVCLGETVGFSATVAGGTGTCEVQWQRRPQGGTWADWTTGNNPTSGPGYLSAAGVYQFRAIYDCDGASCGASTSNVMNVEVFADPDISIAADDVEICIGETVGFSATVTGGTGTCEVQWQRRPQGGTWADWTTGNNPTSGPGYLSAPGVYQFRAIYDCDGASCAEDVSNVVNIEVFAQPEISIESDDIEVCLGETVDVTATVEGGTGSCAIQWQRRPQGGTWTDVANGQTTVIAGTGFLTASGVYQYRARYNCDGASCAEDVSNVVNIEVFADPVITIQEDEDLFVCVGETLSISADVSGGIGECAIQWQRRPQGGTWTDVANGQTTVTAGLAFLAEPGVYQYRAIYNCDGASCDEDISNVLNIEVAGCGSIGSTVWYDDNNDGIRDNNEESLGTKQEDKSVTLELFDAASGDLLATTTTDPNGSYIFQDLVPGDYYIEFMPPASAPVSSTTTDSRDNQQDDDDNGIQEDSNGDGLTDGVIRSPSITLSLGDEPTGEPGKNGGKDSDDDANGDMTIDFGLVRLGSIGSTVFSDDNNNGIQDPGEDNIGDKGKTVELTLLDVDGNVVATTTTDSEGSYVFDNLLPGDYVVEFMPPASIPVSSGPTDTADNGEDGDDNGIQEDTGGDGLTDGVITSPVITLMPGTEPTDEPGEGGDKGSAADDNGDMTVDFGLVPLGSIGSTVFSDDNNNGVQDPGEDNIGDKGKTIELTLLDADGNVVATTTTDSEGSYVFDNLLPGDYVIEFMPPASIPVSSGPTDTADNGEDGDDNGIQEDTDGDGLTDGVITSPVITLMPGTEPTDEPGEGGDKGSAADDNGDMTVDFGLVPLGSIGSTVFSDDNNNGVQDPGEDNIGDKGKTIELTLLDEAGNVVATTTTDSEGSYVFDNLLPGDYVIEFMPPATSPVSSDGNGGDDGVDEDDNGIQEDTDGDGLTDGVITSPVISLMPGTEPTDEPGEGGDKGASDDEDGDMTVDFGLVSLGSIGSTVFSDDNNNGIQDPGEDNIGDKGKTVELTLLDAAGNVVATTTTDSEGSYVFDNLLPGDYVVEFMPPASIPVSSGPTDTADNDEDGDDNGIQEDTDGDGLTDGPITSPVISLMPGTEPTNEPGEGGDKGAAADEDGNMTIDFGLVPLGSIGSTVFSDDNNNGVQDPGEDNIGDKGKTIELTLLDADGNVVATTTTDSEGSYVFDNLLPGDYVIEFMPPATSSVSSDGNGGDDGVDEDDNGIQEDTDGDGLTDGVITSPVITLMPGTEPTDEPGEGGDKGAGDDDNGDNTIDFGLVSLGSIGSTVFSDDNNNGIQDPGEDNIGDKGKTVELTLLDAAGNVVATTTTDSEGSYVFDNLLPGDYVVEFMPPASIPVSSGPTDTADNDEDGDDNGIQEDTDGDGLTDGPITSPVISLMPGTEPTNEPGEGGDKGAAADEDGNMTIDFGLVPLGSIGSTVFSDDNNNGVQDPGEDNIGDKGKTIELTLLDADGNVVATTTTDSEGSYVFDNLLPGDYVVEFMPPATSPVSSDGNGGDDGVDEDDNGIQEDTDGDGLTDGVITSPVITLMPGTEPTDEPGEGGDKGAGDDDNGDNTIDFGLVSLGSIGSTVFSDDNNNGIQDPGEDNIGDKGKTIELTLLDADGNVVATTTTDSEGSYVFDNLLPGDYVVEFMPPATSPVSSDGNGGDDGVDEDDNGIQEDTDGDGLTDGVITSPVISLMPGTEPTNEPGEGGDKGAGADEDGDNTIDFGLVSLGSIGSTVFSDDNNNGIQDPGEDNIGDKGKTIELTLLDADGNVVATTTTDSEGSYVFDNLLPGDYVIEFMPPVTSPVSSDGNGGDDGVDEDDNGIQEDTDGDGLTDGVITSPVISLMLGTEPTNEPGEGGDKGAAADEDGDNTIDFGLVSLGSIGSTVFSDNNNNGVQDPGEDNIGDKGKTIELTLLDEAGNVVATTTTDSEGSYVFENLLPGDYVIEFMPPATSPVSSDGNGGDDGVDSDDNGIQEDTDGDGLTDGVITSPVISLMPGTEPTNEPGEGGDKGAGADEDGDNTIDFGLVSLGSIGSTVFSDNNNNGVQDPGEDNIGDKGKTIELTLLDAGGNVVATTTTDSEGSYVFDNLLPGDYVIEFMPPATSPVSSDGNGGDDGVDSDDNGMQFDTDGDGLTDGVITSPVISLMPGTEPTNEQGEGGDKGAGADEDGDNTIDFGLVSLGSIGSTVFSDDNNNGIMDPGEETVGAKGKTIELTLLDAAGNVVATTTTDSDGSYVFDNLLPGDYTIEFMPPASLAVSSTPTNGADDGVDGDDNGIQQDTNGDGISDGVVTSPVINITPGTEPTNEPGIHGATGVGADENGDNTIDFGLVPCQLECSIVGVDTECAMDNGSATASQVGGNGAITFAWSNGATTAAIINLAPGAYTVTVTDELGCSGVCDIEIADSPEPIDLFDDAIICVEDLPYTWAGGTFTAAGEQSRIIQDANGCDITETFTLTLFPGTPDVITEAAICPGDVFNFLGQSYSTAGTFTVLQQDANGCDYNEVLNLTVYPQTADVVTNEAICPGESFTFLGQSYSTAGTFTVVQQDANGCDYNEVLNLTVYPQTADVVTNEAICPGESFTFLGQSYSTAGTFTVVQQDANGCDYNEVLNLTVYPQTADVVTNEAICPGESFTFLGQSYSTAGTFTVVQQDANGCDYNEVLNLTVYPQTADVVTNEAICPGESFTFLGQSYSTAGTFTVVQQDANGCDYNEVLNLTVYPQTADVETNEAICPGESFTFLGQSYSTAGTFAVVQQDANGCDYNEVLNLTVYPQTADVETNEAICPGESFTFLGQSYSTAGTFTVVQQDANGCDYNEVLNLTVYPQTADVVTNEAICPGESFTFLGQSYNTAGTFTVVQQDANGCDYNEVLNLTVYPQTADVVTNEAICPGESFTFLGQSYSTAGTFTVVQQDANGCDYNEVLNLTVYPQTADVVTNEAICLGESFTFLGQSYSTAGTFTVVQQDANGCDYNEVLNLTVYPQTADVVTNEAICPGESFTFLGQSYSTAGTFTVVQQDANGCDYNEVLNLTVYPQTADVVTNEAICPGESFTFLGQSYSTAGTFTVVQQDANGCDYNEVLNLTVYPQTADVVTNEAICPGESFTFLGQSYSTAGTFTVAQQDANGCDYNEVLNLTVYPQTEDVVTEAAICEGDVFNFQGQSFNTAGTFTIVLQDGNGCNYNEVLNLTVYPEGADVITEAEICDGDFFEFLGEEYDEEGEYTVVGVDANGCSFNQVLELTLFLQTEDVVTEAEICEGEVYNFQGNSYNSPGSFTVTVQDANGCDFNQILNLTVTPTQVGTITNETICEGESFTWEGQSYSTAGTFTASTGGDCAGVNTLNLIVTPTQVGTVANETICEGETFFWEGQSYATAGTFTSSTGGACPGVNTLNLTVTPTQVGTVTNETICEGETFFWEGQSYATAGTFTSSTGGACPGVNTLNLTVTPTQVGTVTNETICEGETFFWEGQSYATAGTFTSSTGGACPGVNTLNLTVTPTQVGTVTNETICEGETFFWEGQSYATAGTFTSSTGGACPGVNTLNLTVTPTQVGTVTNETICEGETFFWEGQSYATAGTFTSSTGGACPGVNTLNLTVTPTQVGTVTNETICEGETFFWEGQSYATAGTFTSSTGGACPGVNTLNLTVTPTQVGTVTNETICEGETFFWEGQSYATAGTFTSSTGGACPGVNTLNLTVTPTQVGTVTNETICEGETFFWEGQSYATAGTFTSSTGGACPGVNTLNLTVTPTQVGTVTNETICEGETFFWEGQSYATAGTFTSSTGGDCPGVNTLNLTVTPTQVGTVTNETICEGETFFWEGQSYATAGTFTASTGGDCPGVNTLNLTVTPTQVGTVTNETICEGETFFWEGQSYATAGTFTASTGSDCPGVNTLNLSVTPTQVGTVTNETICEGETFFWEGQSYATAGTFTASTGGACPGVNTLNLTVTPTQVGTVTNETICEGETFFWEGQSYATAGTFTASTGGDCPGVNTLNLTVTPTQVGTVTNETICEGETFFWEGQSYATAGTFTASTGGDCPGVNTLNLSVTPTQVGTVTNETICEGETFFWEGQSYATAGTFTASTGGACPGVNTLNLTVTPTQVGTVTNETICEGETFFWEGQSYATSGTFTASTGGDCPGVNTLNLTVTPTQVGTVTNETICEGETFFWEGQSYATAGTFTASTGGDCPGVNTLNLTVTPTQVGTVTNETICEGETFFWEGQSYATAGTFTASTGGDCPGVNTLNLTVTPTQVGTVTNETICEGETFFWEGQSYATAGTFTASTGGDCPGVNTLNLTVTPTQVGTVTNETICEGETFFWEGQSYATAGTFTASTGGDCPGVNTLNLTVTPTQVGTVTNETICEGETFFWEGQSYATAGTFTASTGGDCPGVNTLNLTVTPTQVGIVINETICEGETFFWEGQSYATAGTFTASTGGDCPGVNTLNLTVTPTQVGTVTNETICEGETFFWEGQSYATAGTFTASTGGDCPGVNTLNLTVTPTQVGTVTNETICEGETFFWEGQSYATAGTFTASTGGDCPGVNTLNLTVTPTQVGIVINETICEGETFFWEGQSYATAGTFTASTGGDCPGVNTLNLTVTPTQVGTIVNETICEGETFFWEGQSYATAGTFTASTGGDCPGVNTLILSVTPAQVGTTTTQTICEGESFAWEGQIYNAAGTFTSSTGGACPGVNTLILSVTPSQADIVTNETICVGTTFVWAANGLSYNLAGSYVIEGSGCDADQVLNLSFYAITPDAMTTQTICEGETFVWLGNSYAATGVYTEAGIDANGCSFNQILNLTVTPMGENLVTDVMICAGDSYTWNNQAYTAAGTYTAPGVGACAGIQTLNLGMFPVTAPIAESATICNGDFYTFQGQVYTVGGVYVVSLTDANGCAYDATLTLTVETCTDPCEDFECAFIPGQDACNGTGGSATIFPVNGTAPYTYAWSDGQTTATATNLAAGTYGTTITDANGCESIFDILIEESDDCNQSSVSITKLTNGLNDDVTQPVIIVAPGTQTPVTWDYIVTNNGSTTLTNLQVNDDMEGLICTIPSLAPGQSQTCSQVGDASLGMYTNIGTVTATSPSGTVSDQDTSSYIGAFINVEKTASAYCVCPGQEAEFTLTVRLLGGAPGISIENIIVQDSHIPNDLTTASPQFVVASDLGGDGIINFVDANNDGVSDEEFVFTYTLPINTTLTNTAMDIGMLYFTSADGTKTEIGMLNNSSTVTVEATDDCCDDQQGNCDMIFKPTSVVDAGCNGLLGSIDITIAGGVQPYTYVWSNGATTEDISGLAAGTYTLAVSDAEGCVIETTVTVSSDGGCAEIGNLVWEDLDTDGIQDANEPGIAGVGITLYRADRTQVAVTTTDAQGNYCFTGLGAGDYYVEFGSLPTTHVGYIPTVNDNTADGMDSDLVGDTNGVGTTATISLAAGELNKTVDAGFYEANMIGNQVWIDSDGDNDLYDSGDDLVSDVEVFLIEANTDVVVDKVYTDPFGRYLFQTIPAGDYYVEFVAPSIYKFVNANMGSDDSLDSDATPDQFDSQIGRSHVVTVTTGTVDLTIDAGLTLKTVLAFELLALDATRDAENNMNVVEWTTASEINSDFFAIERSIDSTDDFEELGVEKAAGTSNDAIDYFYNDRDMRGAGTYYYRLRVVDQDGSFSYSEIVAVKVSDSKVDDRKVTMDVYPNPVLNQINIDLETEYDSDIDGGIYDAIGQVIKKIDKSSVNAGLTSLKVDVSDLPAGTYLLRMQVGKQVIFEKITKAD